LIGSLSRSMQMYTDAFHVTTTSSSTWFASLQFFQLSINFVVSFFHFAVYPVN
jgi:hypothetical protein